MGLVAFFVSASVLVASTMSARAEGKRYTDEDMGLAVVVSTPVPTAQKAAETKVYEKSAADTGNAGKTEQIEESGLKEKEEKTIKKTLKGTVVFIRKNKISIEVDESEAGSQEILLTLDKNIQVNNVKNFSQIKPRDQVQVWYEETYREPKIKDEAPFILKTVGKEIRLLKSATPTPMTEPGKCCDDEKEPLSV
jgi:hypothetical protein